MRKIHVLTLLAIQLNSLVAYADLTDGAVIGSRLFNVPLEGIDGINNTSAKEVNYNYNFWRAIDPAKDGQCLGYDGGHSGIDFQTKDVAGLLMPQGPLTDRPFYAVSSGIVINAGSDEFNTIAIYDADLNITTAYLHARHISVALDDHISIGDTLGIQGKTGADDKHVHFEVSNGRQTDAACGASTTVDPEFYALKYLLPVMDYETQLNNAIEQKDWRFYHLPGVLLSETGTVVVELFNLTADLDLYLKEGGRPSRLDYSCRPYLGSSHSEKCVIDSSGEWYIGIRGYESGDFSITATFHDGVLEALSDQVFDDIEALYPDLFAPHQQSISAGENYYRLYPNGAYLLEWKEDLWYYLEESGWRKWGPIADW